MVECIGARIFFSIAKQELSSVEIWILFRFVHYSSREEPFFFDFDGGVRSSFVLRVANR